MPDTLAWREVASPAFAVSRVYVGHAYTGWNAAAKSRARSATRTAAGVPRDAVLAQATLVAALLLTNSFERVMAYTGFTLTLMSLLTAAGLFVLRRREPALPRPYRAWGYSVTPLAYVALSLWTLGFVLAERPRESLLGLATVLAGVPVWTVLRERPPAQRPTA